MGSALTLPSAPVARGDLVYFWFSLPDPVRRDDRGFEFCVWAGD